MNELLTLGNETALFAQNLDSYSIFSFLENFTILLNVILFSKYNNIADFWGSSYVFVKFMNETDTITSRNDKSGPNCGAQSMENLSFFTAEFMHLSIYNLIFIICLFDNWEYRIFDGEIFVIWTLFRFTVAIHTASNVAATSTIALLFLLVLIFVLIFNSFLVVPQKLILYNLPYG